MSEELFSYSDSHNLGFFLNNDIQDAQLKALNRREQWMQGAYNYANADRDQTCRDRSNLLFGEGVIPLSDKENSAYFLGDAALREMGYMGSPLEYFYAQQKDLPADVTDEDTARIHVGKMLLDEMRKAYDTSQKTKKEALQNVDALLDGKLTPEQLTEQQINDIKDTGLALNDIMAARRGLEYTNRSVLDKLEQAGEEGYEAIKNNLVSIYENLIKGTAQGVYYTLTGSPEKAPDAGELIGNHVKNTISNISAPYRAFSDNIHMADFLRSHDGDKQVVISLIGDKLRRNAAKEYSEGNMGEHLLNVMDSEISALAETISMLSPENQPNTSSWKASSRAMMNRMDYLAFIRDAMQTGRNEAREQQDSNWLESAGEMSIQLLPYLTGSGEVLGGLRVAQEGIGRAIAALTDEDGVTPDLFTTEGVQAFGKGLVQGQADAAIRGISTRAIGRTFSKLAPKAAAQWGTKTMSRYGAALAAEWGVTTANFAVFLPLAEGGVNFLYDTIIPHDSKLDTGKKQLQQLWDDIGKLDYWGGNAVAGIAWGAAGGYATRNNALSASRLNDIFRMEGLKEEAITEAQKIPDLKERAEAMDAAIKKQAKEDPNGTLKHALAETKKIKSKAEQEAAIKRAQETKKDEAAKAALQLLGISAEANPDPSLVDIYIGGKYNETTKGYEKGATKVTLSAADADLYLGSIMNKSFDALTHRIRESYGAENIMSELSKLYGDRIKLEAILAPEMLDKARERAKEAQQMVDKRVKELMESTKSAEGKPTLSENEARKRALEEVHPSIHKTRNMGELITFGENLEKRADIEKANADKDTAKMPIGTRAFVFSPIRKIGDTIRRILRYTKDVSAREIAEEYGEIYMEDYMSDTGATYTDTWRTLEDFRSTMGDKAPKLTALRSTNPQLADRIANGAQDADVTPAEMDELRRDVREAMSLLLMSDLRSKAASGDIAIPEWARPLFNADLVARQRMETETAIAAGLRMANEMGLMNEAALKLLGVPSKELERALAAIENPTESTYYQTFQDWNLRFAEADMRLDGLSLDELDLFEQRNAAAEQELEEEQRAQEEERAKPAREAVKELEDNGATHEEAVKKVNDNIISAKEENITNNPYVEKNEAFANGECVEVTDEGGIICYSGVLNIADLKLLHNFKLGSDAETGEVNPLEGDYQADHDPIRVFQADDGTLTVISGRHRLAHAKRNGATKIAAYVYKQNEQQDFRWAQQRDIEWNIRDNQATPLEVALYVRGELIDGVPALSADQMERSGMKRRGSLAYQGYIIGTRACDAVITSLRNEQIEAKEAEWISLFSSNAQIQMAGLRAAAEGDGKTGILFSMGVKQGMLELMENLGLHEIPDMFGELLPNEGFQVFVDKYSKLKLKELNERSAYLNALTKKKSSIYAKEYETIINNPSLLKAEKTKVAELKIKWQNPAFYPELREELQDAYKKADLEGWAAAEERAKQKAADTPAEEGLPLFSEDSFNYSVIGEHAQTWEKYVKEGRTFKGRDDGKMRAEIDDSKAKVNEDLITLNSSGLKLGDVLEHKELYKAYPSLKNLKIIVRHLGGKSIAACDYLQGEIHIDPQWKTKGEHSLKEILLHESQHYIQHLENFVGGSDFSNVRNEFERYKNFHEKYSTPNNPFSGRDFMVDWLNADSKAKTMLLDLINLAKNKASKEELTAAKNAYNAFAEYYKGAYIDHYLNLISNETRKQLKPANYNIPKLTSVKLETIERIKDKLDSLPERKKTFPGLIETLTERIEEQIAQNDKREKAIAVISGKSDAGLYLRKAGEVEARAVQKRVNYTEEERKNIPFNKDLEYLGETWGYSLISDHLQSWQRDPVAELGELGRFGNNIEGKLATIGEKVYDQRVITMINALRRRQIELQHIKDSSNDDAQKIFGEMAAIVNQLTSLLPSGYRFGLEPYIEFLTVYADLYGKGDPERAGKALPMDGWQDIMSRSFKKQVERLLAENMRPEDESLFFDIFNEAAVRIDLAGIYEDLKETRKRYVDDVKESWSKTPMDSKEARAAFELEKKIARQEAFDDIQAKYAEEFKTAYKAIGEMRAHRLMDKFLARVIKKLDNHRKDRILNKIARAINGLTPRKIKNGKPVHGRVEKDVYNKVQDYKRLLLMTRSEKELVDQQYADMAQMEPGAEIKVYTYDGDGSAVEITTTVQDYNTYAGFESMTAEQAEVAAASLGSFIKHGKAAWQAAEKATNDAVNEFCAPMYDKWSEDEAARKKREEQHALKPLRRNKILNALASWFSDAQLFKLCGSVDGFEHLNNLTHRIAQAHTYLLSAEKENTDWADNSLYSILGLQGKSGREKSKAKRDFTTHINTNKECKIVLNTQPPDFAAQHLAVLRSSLLRRLFSLTRQKNFHANKFAAAVRYITDSRIMPDELVEEVNAKYGHVGNADKYSKGDFHAYNEYFRSEKFAHLLNINKTVKERTAKSLDEWNNGKFDESGNLIKAPATKRQSTITEITPNQAAYRLLLAEQEDYADMLRRQGYTPQVLQQLREIAGEQMMAYAYALRERMNARTDTIKAIYEQTFGMPFPAVENYFRAYFDVSNAGKKDTSLADLSLGFGAGEGAIEIFYTRQKHNARINPTMNVTTAYGLGTAQQDVIIAYSDQQTHQHLGLFLNKILQNTKDGVRMSDVMKNGLGEEAYHALERQAENMFRLFGQSEPADKVLNRIMSDLGSASALSILNAKFSSILKNTMSLFNTLGGSDKIGAAAWYSSLMRVGTGNGKISVKQIMREPVIRDRFKGWDYDADKAAIYGLTGENVSHGSTNAASRYGMAAFGKVDRDLTAVSAATLYDAVYRKLERENPDITHEALHTICMDEVAQSLGLKGQPMDFRQRALNASRVDWRTLGSYFLGGESWNTFTNCMRLWAQSNVRTQEGKENLYRAAAVWITQGTVMSLLNWAYYWLTDDEEHWEKRNFLAHMTLGTLAGPISGMPIISNLVAGGISTVGRLAGWRDMPYFGTPGFFPLMDVFRTIPALKKAFLNDKLSWWDKSIIINDAVRAAAFAAIATNMRPTSKNQAATLATGVWATAISNGIDFALRLGRASEERHFADDPDESSK